MIAEQGEFTPDETAPQAVGARAARIEEIIDDITERIAAGQTIAWDELQQAHDELMPELGEQLTTLQAIVDAGAAAEEDPVGNEDGSVANPAALLEMLNRELAGYRFLEVVHAGGQGTVLKALQQSTRRLVAVKVMHDGPASERRRQRFEREIRLTAHLELPNVVHVYDSGVIHGQYYLVMQFVDGIPIDDYALLHCQSARERIALVAETVRAISRAHQRGVIHRDLKPSNVLIDADGAPQILDFGLAKALAGGDDEDQCISLIGHVVGTLPYLSPEQATGFDEVDVRGDIYALGVMMCELLTGEYPYDLGATREQARARIIHEKPRRLRDLAVSDGWTGLPRREELDDDLEAIVAKTLAKKKEERYQSAEHLLADLEAYLRGDVVSARADQSSYLLRKALRRYRLHLTVAAIVSAALLTATLISVRYGMAARAERDNARKVALLANATLDDVVTEIDNTIAPLAGGTEARERVMAHVARRLDALEPLVAADVTMEPVLASLREKQGDIAAITGRSAEALTTYDRQIAARLAGRPLAELGTEEVAAIARLYRKTAAASDTPQAALAKAIAAARAWRARTNSAEATHELTEDLVASARAWHRAGKYETAAEVMSEALELITGRHPQSADPLAWKALTADALRWDGEIQTQLGDGTRAQRSLEESARLGAAIIAARPQDMQIRRQTMHTLTALSGSLRNQGRYLESVQPARDAIALGEFLSQAEPRNLNLLRDLITPNIMLANSLRLLKDFEAALVPATATVELADRVVAIEPARDDSQRALGFALVARGSARQAIKDHSNALADFERALTIRELLCRRHPDQISYRDHLAETHNRLASCLMRLSRFPESREHWDEARRIYRELSDRQPDVGRYHLDLLSCDINLASWHLWQSSDRHDLAALKLLQDQEQALAGLCGSPLCEGLDGLCAERTAAIETNQDLVIRRWFGAWP